LEPSLEVDSEALRKVFYEFSQKTHPDTQVTKLHSDQMNATRWSTFINRAYQTLKEPVSRLEYLLELFQVQPQKRSSPPMELAEAYFEFQDALESGSNEAAVRDFQRLLEVEEKKNHDFLQSLLKDWKTCQNKQELMPRLQAYLDQFKYLVSLREDLKKRWSST